MTPASPLRSKLEQARDLPTIPAVLVPLLRYMNNRGDAIDMHQIVKLISQDESLAARCVQMANSPLFACSHQVESIQTAVIALGLERIQEIAVSCSLLKLLPSLQLEVSPAVFWQHSLGCAMVARELAVRFGFPDPAKAYTAGLLHDIGIVALLWVSPNDFRRAFHAARSEHQPLYEAEAKILGLTHCECGGTLARSWNLPMELCEVISCHHRPQEAHFNPSLTSIVCVSDLLCRLSGLGYGYDEVLETDFCKEPGFGILSAHYPSLRPFDLARFTFETESLLEEVSAVVARVYGSLQ